MIMHKMQPIHFGRVHRDMGEGIVAPTTVGEDIFCKQGVEISIQNLGIGICNFKNTPLF